MFKNWKLVVLKPFWVGVKPTPILCELQPVYFQFIKLVKDYQHFIKTDYHNQKINAYSRQIEIQKMLIKRATIQISISKKQYETQKRLYGFD